LVKAKEFSKRAFLSKEERELQKDNAQNEIGTIIYENLSLLRGTAVKIAQALSLHNILPPNIQKELSKSYNSIEPINQALVIKIVQNEYGKSYKEVFKEFHLKPFASASLGQVHFAKTFDDEKLAIKIEYPSINKTIKSDIELLKRFASFKKSILLILEEIEDRLYEEIDYENEAKNTLWAYENLTSEEIVVPKVYERYTTKHILATQFIEGVDLFSWLKSNPSKEQKTKIANAIFNVLIRSIFELKQIQADPNPANYLITEDNRLALIDFGCIKRFDDRFIESYINLMNVCRRDDRDEILKTYKEIGLIESEEAIDDELFEKILKYNRWWVEPFFQSRYKFTKEYLKEGVEAANLFTKKPFNVIKDFVFLDRTMHGLFSIFEQMDVEVDMREFGKYLS